MMEDMAKMPAPSLPISRRDEHESIPGAGYVLVFDVYVYVYVCVCM